MHFSFSINHHLPVSSCVSYIFSKMVQSKVKVNPDLSEERAKVSFNIEEFTNIYYGGADKVAEKRFLGE